MANSDLYIKGFYPLEGLSEAREVPFLLEDGTPIGTATVHPDGTVEGTVVRSAEPPGSGTHFLFTGLRWSADSVVVCESFMGDGN